MRYLLSTILLILLVCEIKIHNINRLCLLKITFLLFPLTIGNILLAQLQDIKKKWVFELNNYKRKGNFLENEQLFATRKKNPVKSRLVLVMMRL